MERGTPVTAAAHHDRHTGSDADAEEPEAALERHGGDDGETRNDGSAVVPVRYTSNRRCKEAEKIIIDR